MRGWKVLGLLLRGAGIRHRTRPALFLTSLVAATAVGVVSIGTSVSSAKTAKHPPKHTLLIGVSGIQTGPDSGSFPTSQDFQAYLNYINKKGGVNGYRFKMIFQDNANSAAQGAQAQQKLLASHPFLTYVVGSVPVTSAVQVSLNSGSNAPLLLAADGANVDSLQAAHPKVPMFGFAPSYDALGPYDLNFVISHLHTTQNVGLVYEDDTLGDPTSAAIAKYASGHGVKLAINLAASDATTDWTPIAQQLQASGAKTVLSFMNGGFTSALQKAASTIGYNPQWVCPSFCLSTQYLQAAGTAANGTYIDSQYPPTTANTPGVKLFRSVVNKYAGSAAVSGVGEGGWEMAAILVWGIQQATSGGKPLTGASLARALDKLNMKLALGPVSYTKTRHWAFSYTAMYRVRNGKFTLVSPASSLLPFVPK